ncbi:methyltransferase [Corynebacterium tapiri]|uniref:Methyltransferase n=1 Tax=Corynebacterium tapiri TaxID=1448266 RepID=A0A5C4U617_9CORY|nr:methyltransferase [Corynebacterium tapiri]TNL99204.1 methyltransferase [Corynebacterium tapiri]
MTDLKSSARQIVQRFRDAGLTVDGLHEHLGPAATAALYRGEPAAVRRVLGTSVIDDLIRAFILRDPVDPAQLAGVETQAVDGGVRSLIDVRPYHLAGTDLWILSDADASMTEHVPGSDHVLGVGAASLTLLQSVPPGQVNSTLDLGCGSGVLSLALAQTSDSVTATDIHPRALDFARANAHANDIDIDVRAGSWFDPVAGQRFDRIVSNPPFVVGPDSVELVYRDSGLGLDGASQLMVSQAPGYLTENGSAHLVAAWVHHEGQSWQQRVASWLPERGVCAWVLQRDVVDPETYVSTWLRDESLDPRSAAGQEKMTRWLDYFAEHEVTAIGVGFVAIQNIGDAPSEITAEELTQGLSADLGPEVAEYFARAEWLRTRSAVDIAQSQFAVRPGLAREEVSVANEDAGVGFAPAALRLTRTDGPRFSHEVDEALAAIVAGLHPQGLSLVDIVELYALSHDLDGDALLDDAVVAIVDLIRHGLVIPTQLCEENE